MLITEKMLQTYTTLVYVGPVSMMLWRGSLNFYLYLDRNIDYHYTLSVSLSQGPGPQVPDFFPSVPYISLGLRQPIFVQGGTPWLSV